MAFKRDVARVPGLESAFCPGLQALRGSDRRKIKAANTRSLSGSVDIDNSLRASFPDAARWDYVIGAVAGNPRSERLHWIEVHPATSGENVSHIRAKYSWLRAWLGGEGTPLRKYPREIIWIASGKSAYHQGMPVIKKLASEGVRFEGRSYSIPA